MIRNFAVENFFSIKEKQTISFRLTNRNTGNGWFSMSKRGDCFSLALAIFGKNASGKTNMLRSLSFLLWMMKEDSFDVRKNIKANCITWFLCENPTIFEIELENQDGTLYKYFLKIMRTNTFNFKILEETLSYKELKARSRYVQIYKRTHNLKKDDVVLNIKRGFPKNFPAERLREDTTVLSACPAYNVKLPIISLINMWSNVKPPFFEEDAKENDDYIKIMDKFKDNEKFKRKVNHFLKQIDLGFDGFDIKNVIGENDKGLSEENYFFYGKHFLDGTEKILPFPWESQGTHSFFFKIMFILPFLENGGIVIIDEIDVALHPAVVEFILNLFNSKKINKGNAQIIFTTHSPEIMDILGKSHIWITEKEGGKSEFFPLSDYKDVRDDVELCKKYLAGKYGGTPNILLPDSDID